MYDLPLFITYLLLSVYRIKGQHLLEPVKLQRVSQNIEVIMQTLFSLVQV